jgi:hypothetical protein
MSGEMYCIRLTPWLSLTVTTVGDDFGDGIRRLVGVNRQGGVADPTPPSLNFNSPVGNLYLAFWNSNTTRLQNDGRCRC